MADLRLVNLFPNHDSYGYKREEIKEEIYPKAGSFFNMPCYDNPIGIEIEAENFNGCGVPLMFWRTDEDGSLKKAGVEFISVPLKRRSIDYALHEIQFFGDKLEFGHRTSVHLHCNVSQYTLRQLYGLVAMYSMLEECFYSLADPIRECNSFCYPIIGTAPKLEWFNSEDHTTKYCAFNIAPVKRQMTVEFRHLHGTTDLLSLRRWIQIGAKLVYYCGNVKEPIEFFKKVVSEDKVKELLPEIFGDTAIIFDARVLDRSISNGSLWALALLSEAP